VRLAVCVLIALLVTACGSAEPAADGARYGISLDVPDGWRGEIKRGAIRIARDDFSVLLYEYEPAPADRAEAVGFFKDGWPVQLTAADFEVRAGTAGENSRAEADAMLAGLDFPDWGPWELESP
jgi:hypothetical protein